MRWDERINVNIAKILKDYKTIAVVGISNSPFKISNQVSGYMLSRGYEIIPVNPNYEKVLSLICYPDLKAVKKKIEIVNIFRQPQYVPAVVDDAIAIGAKVVWMQSGIINEQAAIKALENGILVVMDRCIKIEHSRL